jgi:hypothetical protein
MVVSTRGDHEGEAADKIFHLRGDEGLVRELEPNGPWLRQGMNEQASAVARTAALPVQKSPRLRRCQPGTVDRITF